MPGRLFLIVGPSGVGKDSIIDELKIRLGSRVHFPRREITRPADPSEDFISITAEAFKAENYAIAWQAHGLSYGIRREDFLPLARGYDVILNASRALVSKFEDLFDPVFVVQVTANPDSIATRLANRGRESRQEIKQRLNRAPRLTIQRAKLFQLDNSGPLSAAVESFLAIMNDD